MTKLGERVWPRRARVRRQRHPRTRAHSDHLARAIPTAEVRIMDTGHLAAMEHSEENWARVLQIARERRSAQ